jgi:hypothetical protein
MGLFDWVKKIIPAAVSFIPGIGQIAGPALGALMGGGAQDLSPQEIEALIQAQKDSARARELTESAVDRSRGGYDLAMEEWGKDEPMREGYRTGAMNFASRQNPFAVNPATGAAPEGGVGATMASALGGFDPNAKFNASMGLMRAPQPGFAPSTGYGGTGGYTPLNPTTVPGPRGIFGGLMDNFGGVSEGGPMSQPEGMAGGDSMMGSLMSRVMQRFGGQERGSATDFITPSRRGSSIKRAV